RFTAALKHQHNSLLDVMERQNVPFHEVVEHIVDERIEGVSPLIQIMFALQNNDIPDLRLGKAKISIQTPRAEFMDLDLDIDITEQDGQLTVDWTYAERLFEGSLIESMADHFESLLEAVLANPDAMIKNIELLSKPEVHHLVDDLNANQTDYDKNQCIHALFEQQAAANPNHVAVAGANSGDDDKQLTYQQLNEKANQLAHYLKAHHDVKPGTLVGLCVERSLEMAIAILAILKAGGAYVPLDPGYPQDRLNYMLEDADLSVVLSQDRVHHVLANFNGTLLALDGLSESEDHFCGQSPNSNLPLDAALTSSSLCYVIYTSGSTGKPKGVMVEHGSLVNYQQQCA
ncbi:MAG: AMP-binding protein, partial [Psychrosphaera sp.]|nr:AMP-binding protein [Psychrosphaera sp.]